MPVKNLRNIAQINTKEKRLSEILLIRGKAFFIFNSGW